jgi:hypothetical protein
VILPFNLLLVACLTFLSLAQGAERIGDATFADAYREHRRIAKTLEDELLFLIETAPDEERFNLYWTYDQFSGTWLQIELLQAQLVVAVSADSPSEEEEARTILRDQAQFALWELVQAEVGMERNVLELKRPDHLRINGVIRELLREVRIGIGHLLLEQCARMSCALGGEGSWWGIRGNTSLAILPV